tara:strand:- start:42552 stop:43547 length:996 start_codon:yes stop_codon:yes gene_type:complete
MRGPLRNPKLAGETKGRNYDKDELVYHMGIDGDPNYYYTPELNKPPFGEVNLEGVYGSGVRTGPDRMNERTDPSTGEQSQFGGGFGAVGAYGCSAVDIYAGLASHHTARGKVPETPVNPSSEKDAARVYVSQMCDVDDMFGFPDGNLGNIKSKSAVVAKADQIRIEGREGVKIVSGVDIKNSKDEYIRSVPPINLIAGGNVGEDKMHPIPKGNNLLTALDDIVDNINELSAILDNFLMFQHKFNTALMSHKHPSPTAIGISQAAVGTPTALCGGQTLISMDCAAAGFNALVSGLSCKKDLMLHTMRNQGVKVSRLARYSNKFINSRSVYTS